MEPVLTNITLDHEAGDVIGKPTQAVHRNRSHFDVDAGDTPVFCFTAWCNLKSKLDSRSRAAPLQMGSQLIVMKSSKMCSQQQQLLS